MIRVGREDPGAGAIEVEVWQLDELGFATFVDEIPAPSCIGRFLLEDGSEVAGFLYEPIAVQGPPDITHYVGWRAFRADTRS